MNAALALLVAPRRTLSTVFGAPRLAIKLCDRIYTLWTFHWRCWAHLAVRLLLNLFVRQTLTEITASVRQKISLCADFPRGISPAQFPCWKKFAVHRAT
jgi:hypothetical protein